MKRFNILWRRSPRDTTCSHAFYWTKIKMKRKTSTLWEEKKSAKFIIESVSHIFQSPVRSYQRERQDQDATRLLRERSEERGRLHEFADPRLRVPLEALRLLELPSRRHHERTRQLVIRQYSVFGEYLVLGSFSIFPWCSQAVTSVLSAKCQINK